MSAQGIDLRWHTATLRRRAGWLITAAIVGLGAGTAYVWVQPPPLTSTTLVLLPTPAVAQSSNSDVPTQVRVATSAHILEQAGKVLEPDMPVRKVRKMVEVTAPTDQIIQVDATSTNAAEAEALSQAVADAYVDYVRGTAREVTNAAMAGLKNRREDLQQEINTLHKEIAAANKRRKALDPSSPEAREEARLLAGLRTQQANLALQFDKVEDKIATGLGSSAGTSTSVIQPATDAIGLSLVLRLLIWAPIAAVACAALAALIVLATSRRDSRLRLRDDIADAVGSPVLATVRSRPQRSVAGWATLLETYQATPVESWALRQLLRGLAASERKGPSRIVGRLDHPRSITVISLSGDGRGLAIGPQLAAFASSLGIVTRLVPSVGHVRAPHLWAVCGTERKAPARPNLLTGTIADQDDADLTIVLVVLERTHPYLDVSPATAATILSVASATATEQDLARVAVAVDDAGRRIDGIVVADPDVTDHTSGRHTMDERSRRSALPTRITGLPPSSQAAGGQFRRGS